MVGGNWEHRRMEREREWEHRHARARRDADGDGVPDRFDRHPYNPNRS